MFFCVERNQKIKASVETESGKMVITKIMFKMNLFFVLAIRMKPLK
jgi:hypothetical protein